MKQTLRSLAAASLFAATMMIAAPSAVQADEVVNVNTDATWLGYMNVFNRNNDGTPGAFQFGSGWGFNDLTAVFGANDLTLGPNTIGDPDPYWYIGGGAPGAQGNKWMDANAYVQVDDLFAGTNVTFQGTVLSNTFTDAHTGTVFIRDFAPDFSTFNEVTAALTPGDFQITLATDAGAGRHVQYGFNVQGENVWVTDVVPFGNIVITAVPEPGSVALLTLTGLAMVVRRRRR